MTDEVTAVKSFDESMVSELFHENSKMHRSDDRIADRILAITTSPIMLRMTAAHKRYPSARKVALPEQLPEAHIGFDEAVLTRRSSRDFRAAPISFAEAAKVLYLANGVTGTVETHEGRKHLFRAAPSGGALYPIEIYLCALRVDCLPPGIYHYNAVGNVLELVREGDTTRALQAATYTEELDRAAMVIALTGISLKNRVKYGERGYRFMLMEAGHVAQNVLLTANTLRLIAVPIGGFIDDEMDRLLGMDGLDEVSLYLVAVGRG